MCSVELVHSMHNWEMGFSGVGIGAERISEVDIIEMKQQFKGYRISQRSLRHDSNCYGFNNW